MYSHERIVRMNGSFNLGKCEGVFMDLKAVGGALTALGIIGALLGVYLFQLSATPPRPHRLIAALALGVVFVVVGIFLAVRPAKPSA
jgi:flagellar motor component MotA